MFSLPSPDVPLEKFHEPGIFNYSVLLLSEDSSTLYVGAREAVFALSALNISQKQHEVGQGLPLRQRVGRRPAQCFSSTLPWAPPGAAGPLPAASALPVPATPPRPLSFPLRCLTSSLWKISGTRRSRGTGVEEACSPLGSCSPGSPPPPTARCSAPSGGFEANPDTFFIHAGLSGCPFPEGEDSFLSQ